MTAPFFSVVVPTRDRPEQLRDCLSSLAAQKYPRGEFEVVVVDDGGKVDLAPVVANAATDLECRLLRRDCSGGPGAARNTGAAAARGAWLAFIDDDCLAAPNWLSALATAAVRHPGALLGGSVCNGLPENSFAAATQSLLDFLYARWNSDPLEARFFTANNLALPSTSFRALDGFAPWRTGEDRDLCTRHAQAGGRLTWVREALVEHCHTMGLWEFLRQHYGYGRGSFRYHRFHQHSARHNNVPPVGRSSFYFDLLGHPSRTSQSKPLRQSGLILLSQVATATGMLRESISGGKE